MQERHSRRDFHRVATAALAVSTVAASPSRETSTLTAAETDGPFQLRYLLGSCLYGYADSATIAAEVRKTGATAIDLWPKVHGNQREQLDEMGEFAFAELLDQHDIRLGCLTQY